ncbi:nuclear transport factor 2 family protein [Thermodesulfobacteriota bacterium]
MDASVGFGEARGMSGREAVIKSYRRNLEQFGPSFHYPHTQTVEFLGEDEAVGTVTGHAKMAIDGKTFVTAIRYLDKYAREGGSWRFSDRRLWTLYVVPLDELPTALGDKFQKRWPGTPPSPGDLPETLDSWKAFVSGIERSKGKK